MWPQHLRTNYRNFYSLGGLVACQQHTISLLVASLIQQLMAALTSSFSRLGAALSGPPASVSCPIWWFNMCRRGAVIVSIFLTVSGTLWQRHGYLLPGELCVQSQHGMAGWARDNLLLPPPHNHTHAHTHTNPQTCAKKNMQRHVTVPWVLNVFRTTITMASEADSRGRRHKLTRTSVSLKAR